MKIQDELYNLNKKMYLLGKEYKKIIDDYDDFNKKNDLNKSKIKTKYANLIQDYNYLKEELYDYFDILSEYTDKPLIDGVMKPYSKNSISDYERILASIKKNIMNIDKNSRIAAGTVNSCNECISMINYDINELENMQEDELNRINFIKEKMKNDISNRITDLFRNFESVFLNDKLKEIYSVFKSIEEQSDINEAYFRNMGQLCRRNKIVFIGTYDFNIKMPEKLKLAFRGILRHFYDESTKTVYAPFYFKLDSSEEIVVEYTELNEAEAVNGIQVILLNFMKLYKFGEYNISIFDYLNYNTKILGELNFLNKYDDGILDSVITDNESLKKNIYKLAAYYRTVDEKIGAATVHEYNSACSPDEKIPYRILIINRSDDDYRHSQEAEMLYILNNAARFGITIIRLSKNIKGGSKNGDIEEEFLSKSEDSIHIISDKRGNFYIENNKEWFSFRFYKFTGKIPDSFKESVELHLKKNVIGTKYFDRYKYTVAPRTSGKRKSIHVPFAVDKSDKEVVCSFDNENFAAYIMGAAGSGKSTLLHTIITGIIMNYHPDEVELWLMDFKMLEFKRYVKNSPPHVKYLLLEKSETLVFDIVDKLSEEMKKREIIFSQNGWLKLEDVPLNVYMPAIFVIIDEFAQMSQILKETKGLGGENDYSTKLENLLAKGRALGFKFIFSSQTYTTGITGLTETACKQIQTRFALKNTADEIKQTLNISFSQNDASLFEWVNKLPPYTTIFKWKDENGNYKVDKLDNMYTEENEVFDLISGINEKYIKVSSDDSDLYSNPYAYTDKNSIFIDGDRPQTFKSQISSYKAYESSIPDYEKYDDDIYIYPGVACSFNMARPFVLCNKNFENILITGNNIPNTANIIVSIMTCYARSGNPIEIISDERSNIIRKYREIAFKGINTISSIEDICSKISELKNSVMNRKMDNRLIAVFGLENIFDEFEVIEDSKLSNTISNRVTPETAPEESVSEVEEERLSKIEVKERNIKADIDSDSFNPGDYSISEIMSIRDKVSPEKFRQIIDDYNSSIENYNESDEENESDKVYGRKQTSDIHENISHLKEHENIREIYDARDDFIWLIKNGSRFGIHFVLCFEHVDDFKNLKIKNMFFRHKILFTMSKENSFDIIGKKDASMIDEKLFMYSDGKKQWVMRPHIYKGISCNGWIINENNIIEKKYD